MMNIRSFAEKIVNLQNSGLAFRFLLSPLTLCSHVYGAALRCNDLFYRSGLLKTYDIGCPVVSVGNITVGGTGKTPTVCSLAHWLKKQGIRVAVVTRGYRGRATAAPLIVSDGTTVVASAEAAGDEALMLGRKLSGIPVIACRDRVAAGSVARNAFNASVVILDDGFQHRRLRRTVDIVLVNAANPFGNGFLLPRGILREHLSALQRAHIFVITKTDRQNLAPDKLRTIIAQYNPDAPVFTASFKITEIKNARTDMQIPWASLNGMRVAGLCSIGDPAGFATMLSRLPVQTIGFLSFPDHHRYRPADYRHIERLSKKVDALITTEKDIAKIDLTMLQTDKLIVLAIEQVIDNQESFFKTVKDRAGI